MENKPIGTDQLDTALTLLSELLEFHGSDPIELVVCGGSALIALNLVPRTTRDVDVLALRSNSQLIAPVPLPDLLVKTAEEVRKALSLPIDWFNNGPSSNEGGLFQMGLPEGLEDRLTTKRYGSVLSVSFIGRVDQIYFKLWAAVDRGGYHIDDLLKLNPTEDELISAAFWTMEKDVSEGYRMVLKELLTHLGFENAVHRLS